MNITVRDVFLSEHKALSELLVSVYSQLPGFPLPDEQPGYYEALKHVGELVEQDSIRVMVAVSDLGNVLGCIAYFDNMSVYGSGSIADHQPNACGIRFLAVDANARGLGIGRKLVNCCFELAREANHQQIILHTTTAMIAAWRLCESLGFQRSTDLDFLQEGLPVYGFRYHMSKDYELLLPCNNNPA
ncbi:MAG: GNAT family N-acetyltransferase [Reinekea sp.]|jgi:ribosomal protein S18 acetylase RimI-like enzyme